MNKRDNINLETKHRFEIEQLNGSTCNTGKNTHLKNITLRLNK